MVVASLSESRNYLHGVFPPSIHSPSLTRGKETKKRKKRKKRVLINGASCSGHGRVWAASWWRDHTQAHNSLPLTNPLIDPVR